jgi:uncharacterized repeat protein (TIGR02543 family)
MLHYPGVDELWESNILNGSNLGDVPDSGYVEVDPALTLIGGWNQISASSPAVDAAVGDYLFVVEDIDGIERDQTKDIGADELGSGPRQPLTADDVGPDWLKDPNLPVGLNLTISGSGQVALNPAGGVYTTGTWVTLTAIPDSGYTFSGWSGDLVSTNNPDSVLMDENKNIAAIFDPPLQYKLALWHTGSGTIELDPPGGSYSPGTTVSILAIPQNGWSFLEWSGSLVGSQNPDSLIMDENKFVNATFLQDPTAINEDDHLPLKFKLNQNYPNPFNPVTTISFSIDQQDHTQLKLYDTLGNEVAELVNGSLRAGVYQIRFDGSALASGVYYYRLTSGGKQKINKMILLR